MATLMKFMWLLMSAATLVALADVHCPYDLEAWSGTVNLVDNENKALQPYQFVVSPTEPTNSTPTNTSSPCFGAGYISQFSSTNLCLDYNSAQAAAPIVVLDHNAINGNDGCLFNFTGSYNRVFTTVFLKCDGSDSPTSNTFIVSPTFTSYTDPVTGVTTNALTGTSSAVCGSAANFTSPAPAPTTTPTPTVTANPDLYTVVTFTTLYWEDQLEQAIWNALLNPTPIPTVTTTTTEPTTTTLVPTTSVDPNATTTMAPLTSGNTTTTVTPPTTDGNLTTSISTTATIISTTVSSATSTEASTTSTSQTPSTTTSATETTSTALPTTQPTTATSTTTTTTSATSTTSTAAATTTTAVVTTSESTSTASTSSATTTTTLPPTTESTPTSTTNESVVVRDFKVADTVEPAITTLFITCNRTDLTTYVHSCTAMFFVEADADKAVTAANDGAMGPAVYHAWIDIIPTTTTTEPEDKKMKTGEIVGIVIGCVAGFALLLGVAICIFRKRSTDDNEYHPLDRQARGPTYASV